MEEIIKLVQSGKLMEAETKLFAALDYKRDAILESGREHLSKGILQIHESEDDEDEKKPEGGE